MATIPDVVSLKKSLKLSELLLLIIYIYTFKKSIFK